MNRQFKKNISEAKGTKTPKQSLAEAVFTVNTNIRARGLSPAQVLLGRQPLLPAYMRTKENTPKVSRGPPKLHSSTPYDALEALLQIHNT